MEKLTARIFTALVAVLSLAGFSISSGRKRFLGLMNVDTAHSVLRVPLIAATLYAASDRSNLRTTRTVLTSIGIVYLAIGSAGLLDRRVGGLLPSKLTTFDIAYHFATGTLSLWMGQRPGRMLREE